MAIADPASKAAPTLTDLGTAQSVPSVACCRHLVVKMAFNPCDGNRNLVEGGR